MKWFYSLLPLILPGLLISCSEPEKDPRLGAIGSRGMVVSAHPEASEIGLKILKKGGNAMDAACAVEFALAVCYPAAGNIAGGGFWVVYTADHKPYSLDYREKAPASAHKDLFLDSIGEVVKGASTQTLLASGVPGTVAGMVEAHRKFGSLPWADIVQPAIDLARTGFPITKNQANDFNNLRNSFVERNTWTPPFVKDTTWQTGDLLVQPDLAVTLERIRDQKRDGFYSGATADLIVAQMKASGGIITHEDLNSYQAVWREPISGTFRDLTFFSMAPPSSGGVALKQLLGLTELTNSTASGHNMPQTVHLMAEAEKLVYADRAEYLGDSDFVPVPVEQLTRKEYLKARAGKINPEKATPSDSIRSGSIPHESDETTHYSVTDQWGNAVSATTTLNGGYGNRIVVEGAGFLMNNQMDDFSIKPGYPNLYGLIGSSANAIEPGKRMLSSMTPTILTRDKELYMVVGTPGGSTIITSVYQTILNVVDHGMTMQEAVTAGRFHHQWLPDVIQYEPLALDTITLVRLTEMGHSVKKVGKIGRVDAILVTKDKKYEGGADPRGDDTAKGY